MAKLELVSVLTFENLFSQSFHFKTNRKSMGSSKKRYQGFQNSPPFERSACFYLTICESFKRFQYFNFETNFLKKTKTFFKKLEYRFLVETTKIENTSFPFKSALSEANVKINRMATTKWTYQKEWDLPVTTLFFLENFFQFQNLLKRVNLMYQRPKCPYSYFL